MNIATHVVICCILVKHRKTPKRKVDKTLQKFGMVTHQAVFDENISSQKEKLSKFKLVLSVNSTNSEIRSSYDVIVFM